MKEVIILVIVTFLTGVIYWGVEPLAHSLMHPEVAPVNFNFPQEAEQYAKWEVKKAEEKLDSVKGGNPKEVKGVKLGLKQAKKSAIATKVFWDEVKKIDISKGDASRGAGLVGACAGCHGIVSQKMPSPMDAASASDAFGVAPPDLSNIGYLYDPQFLAALIKNPPMALHVEMKFDGAEKVFPMTPYFASGEDANQEIADLVAYFVSIAPKKMEDKEVYESACLRCHDLKYAKLKRNSKTQALEKYLGSNPPDLSIMVRARGHEYLENFINDPQRELPNTAMPRVGLKKHPQEQVIEYLESVGDSKKAEREALGYKIMGYFLILSIFAILWKFSVWRRVH